MSFNNAAIVFVERNYYRIKFWSMRKNEDIYIN